VPRWYLIVMHAVLVYVVLMLFCEVLWGRALEDRVRELQSRITGAAPPARGEMKGLGLWDW
jgi:hypothetical protein